MRKNVLVVFGGQSTEHDISVLTGVMCLSALQNEKYAAYPVYISREGSWHCGEELKRLKSEAKDGNGAPILSDQRMDLYRRWFAEYAKECIRIDFRGSRIDGMTVKSRLFE